jgi:hypothetical protein
MASSRRWVLRSRSVESDILQPSIVLRMLKATGPLLGVPDWSDQGVHEDDWAKDGSSEATEERKSARPRLKILFLLTRKLTYQFLESIFDTKDILTSNLLYSVICLLILRCKCFGKRKRVPIYKTTKHFGSSKNRFVVLGFCINET